MGGLASRETIKRWAKSRPRLTALSRLNAARALSAPRPRHPLSTEPRVRMTVPMMHRRQVEVDGLLIGPLWPLKIEVIATLLAARPRPLSPDQLADFIYTGEDGGPDWSRGTVSLMVLHLRRDGVPIRHRVGYGYTL